MMYRQVMYSLAMMNKHQANYDTINAEDASDTSQNIFGVDIDSEDSSNVFDPERVVAITCDDVGHVCAMENYYDIWLLVFRYHVALYRHELLLRKSNQVLKDLFQGARSLETARQKLIVSSAGERHSLFSRQPCGDSCSLHRAHAEAPCRVWANGSYEYHLSRW